MLRALTRAVSPAFAQCELTHLQREPIDLNRARAQHEAYECVLESLGCRVERLTADGAYPDCVFVEDTAIVVDDLAVITRPGADSRRGETAAVAAALAAHRPLRHIGAPGTVDGGDVLVAGRSVFVGQSSRTNASALQQMRQWLEPLGYEVRPVEVARCLHLKSAVTQVSDRTLLVNPEWIDTAPFAGFHILATDPAEPSAANALRIGQAVVFPEAFPRTRARLESHGVRTVPVDVSELAKAEGAVTCCSVVFDDRGGR